MKKLYEIRFKNGSKISAEAHSDLADLIAFTDQQFLKVVQVMEVTDLRRITAIRVDEVLLVAAL